MPEAPYTPASYTDAMKTVAFRNRALRDTALPSLDDPGYDAAISTLMQEKPGLVERTMQSMQDSPFVMNNLADNQRSQVNMYLENQKKSLNNITKSANLAGQVGALESPYIEPPQPNPLITPGISQTPVNSVQDPVKLANVLKMIGG